MTLAAAQQQGILLTQFSSGAVIDDIDVTVKAATFCAWDYNGNIDHEVLALGITFTDQNDTDHDQYFSAGELTYFVPSNDGNMLVPVSDKQMLNDNCNAAKFILSLLECGFPADLLGNNVSSLVGLKCHVKQQAQPVRTGLIRGGKNPDRAPQVLLVERIIEMPGQAAAQPAAKPAARIGKPGVAAPAPAKPAAPAKAPAKPVSPAVAAKPKVNGQAGVSTVATGDDKTMAAEILNTILTGNGGSVSKKDLAKLSFPAAGAKVTAGEIDTKTKNRLVQLLFQDSFLHELAGEGAIAYDGNEIVLLAQE